MLLLDPVLGAAPVAILTTDPASGQREVRFIRRPRRGRRQHITTLGGLGGDLRERCPSRTSHLCLVVPSPVAEPARFPWGAPWPARPARVRCTASVTPAPSAGQGRSASPERWASGSPPLPPSASSVP